VIAHETKRGQIAILAQGLIACSVIIRAHSVPEESGLADYVLVTQAAGKSDSLSSTNGRSGINLSTVLALLFEFLVGIVCCVPTKFEIPRQLTYWH